MAYYEIEVTATRMICVQADTEEDAIDRAEEEYGEWRTVEAQVEDEFDPTKNADFIKQYKESGDMLKVNYS